MTSGNGQSPDFLDGLRTLLAGAPEGQDAGLRNMLEELGPLREEPGKQTLENAFELFGTAAGKQKAWQTPFRECGILSLALMALDSKDTTPPLRKQYLRVIGNCVANNDTNREVVTIDLQKLIAWLPSEHLTTIVLIVLFNLCNDFDPAKAAAAVLRLDATIAERLFLGKFPDEALDYAVDLLTWTTEKLTAEQLTDVNSLKTFADLLKVALQYDEDHYHEYVAILVHYLQDPEFQQKIATPELLDELVVLMLDFESRLTAAELDAVFQELAITKRDDRSSSEETNVLLLSQLVNSISAVSSTDAFARNFTVRSPVIERVRTGLVNTSSRYSPSLVCACVMLGNLAMSDEVCIDIVSIMVLHIYLVGPLFFSRESALLYAVAGLLRHLAMPEANRTILGDARFTEACHQLFKVVNDPAVHGEVAALLGRLVTNNIRNIERVVMHRVGESRGEPGELAVRSVSNGPTALGTMVQTALAPAKPLPSTSMKNLSIESGRTIVAILRYLGRPNAEGDIEAIRKRMFEVPHVARPVGKLVRQRFYADARAEGLLGLGLMAQSPEGAACVIEEIKEDPGLLDAIKEFAEGETGGVEQSGPAAGRDYQNAVVLLQALRNNWSDETDKSLKDRIVSLQELLGKLMI